MTSESTRHKFGIDVVASGAVPPLTGTGKHQRIGMVTNDASRTSWFTPGRKSIIDAGANVVRLFAPEHGIGAHLREGAKVTNQVDRLTGIEVISLYGSTVIPRRQHLEDLDAVVFDLADVGVRFYTYLWTLSHMLEACAEAGIPIYVLDRPNPLGGDLSRCEGPLLDEENCYSFVGRWEMPIRYGLTIGELATYWVSSRSLTTELNVIEMPQWDRSAVLSDNGWIPPSPNIPSAHTAAIYPATCYAEGLNLAEGRGTPYPFRTIGAPWIDSFKLSHTFNSFELPGIHAIPHEFVPTTRTYKNESCFGVFLTITDPHALQPVMTGFSLFSLVAQLWPDNIHQRNLPPLPDESTKATSLDKLVGRTQSFESLLTGELPALSRAGVQDWVHRVESFLIYD